MELPITIFPDGETKEFVLEPEYSYRIAGKELAELVPKKMLKILRLTEEMMKSNSGTEDIFAFFNDKNTCYTYPVTRYFKQRIKSNIILLNCIDTNGSEDGWLSAEDIRTLNSDCLVGKTSSRNIAFVLLPSEVSIADQEKMITLFNKTIRALRYKYASLFLTNFRDNDRKRVSFDFCYRLLSWSYEQL